MNTLIATAEQYVKDNPRCLTVDMAIAMSISLKRAQRLVSELALKGYIHKTRVPGSISIFLTHGPGPGEPLGSGMPKQVIVGEWTPMDIKPQGIFGPLGM